MKKSSLFVKALSAILPMLLCLTFLSSCSSAKDSGAMLSPALGCLAEQNTMAKATVTGGVIEFSPDDFARALNIKGIESITITSLPATADGELRVGSAVLTSSQTLSAASVSLMTFYPSSAVSSSSFRFTVDDSPVEMCCQLYVLDETNHAPTLSLAPKTALEVSTYRDVTFFGTLPYYDPDGDNTYIDVVSYPEKGLLVVEDRTVGSYRYIPYDGSTGKDSFTYVARDIYGNYSASATVSLRINKADTSVSYVDLNDSPYHNAALAMTERGIMSGTQVGSATYFYPDTTVSRAEFTVMAMNAAGITEVNPVSATVFADDNDIPERMKSYIAAAYDLGYIKGSEVDGKLCFRPNDPLTRAEAAVMLANMLDAAAPTVTPVFGDSEDIPAWATASVNSLSAMGVLSSYSGNIEPLSQVTRGDAAGILSNFMLLKDTE